MGKISTRYCIVLIYVVLALSTLIAFEQVRRNDFTSYDDDRYVTGNPQVTAGITRQSVIWAFTRPYVGNWHPLTWLSHMLDCELFGLDPFWHHLTSLFFHIANTLLLFAVLRRMTGTLWRSGFVAALFALHPLHAESVAWVAERKDVLSTFFWIATMLAYVRYVKRPGFVRYALVVVFFALGLMAKPMLVTLPFVLLLLDYWPLGRLKPGQLDIHKAAFRLVAEKIPLILLTAASCIVTFMAQQTGKAINPMGLIPRTAIGVISYTGYIAKMLWPTKLAMFYPLPESIDKGLLAGCAIFLAAVTAAAIYRWRRWPWFLVGWLWYLGTLVPVIGVVKVGGAAMADRYTYVPLIGLFIIISWGTDGLLARWRYGKVALGISAVSVLSALALCTWFQAGYWRNSITLYKHTLAVTERNHMVHNNLGMALYKQGRINEAVEHYKTAIKLDKNAAVPYWNLGDALAKQGWNNKAISQYERALELEPNKLKAHRRLARILFEQKKFDEAVIHFAKVVELEPGSMSAHNNLGLVLTRQGDFAPAETQFRKALQIKKNYFSHVNLAVLLARQGKTDEAIEHYRKAIKLNPKDQQAWAGLKAALAVRNK